MNKIRVSTPGKLMLLGEHSVVYDRECIVAAVDQRFVVEVKKMKGREIVVEAPGVGLRYYRKSLKDLGGKRVPKGIRFVELVVCKFFETYGNGEGLKIQTKNHFSAKYGFGSSAAVTVGLAKALYELYELKISDEKLFEFCYQVVLDVQGVGSGFDVAAALYGGILSFMTGGKRIQKLKVKELPFVVGYTGVKADTATLVRQVGELKRQHPIKVNRWFDEISYLVKKAKKNLTERKWLELGELMDENQRILSELGVSSVELNRLIDAGRKAGAYGAKLSGAGGGDCMIALAGEDKRKRVEKAIENAGGEILRVKLGGEGVRIEK